MTSVATVDRRPRVMIKGVTPHVLAESLTESIKAHLNGRRGLSRGKRKHG